MSDDRAIELLELEGIVAGLRPPAMGATLRERLISIPSITVGCDRAADLISASLAADPSEGALSPADRTRLDFHLGRCDGCREAQAALAGVSDLVEPKPAPWFPARLAVSRPARRRTPRGVLRTLFSPKGAVGFAYGAAFIVMVTGFNPGDLARKAGSNLKIESVTASSKATAASSTVADRVGAFQDRMSRRLAVFRGRASGYSRAILSNAMSLVMKSEEPTPPRSRPRNGDEKGAPRNETAIPSSLTSQA
jgi:hypothetical protein